MKSIINPNLFRHTDVSSDGFNNLCTLIHPVHEDGLYTGEVYIGKLFAGSFELTVGGGSEATQADIDVSAFDPLYRRKCEENPEKRFGMSKEGCLVIYTSGHHNGAHVRVYRSDKEKNHVVFDTRKPGKDDLVVFRPFHPGRYKLFNRLDGRSAEFVIEEKKEGYVNPVKLEPLTIPLTASGFEIPGNFSVSPFQALIIRPETECSLVMEIEKPAPPVQQTSKKK
jgi:hypothetical protein